MKTDAKTFTDLLPALQHLARFPTANLEHVCKTREVDAGAVRGALVDMVGDVTRWDEDYLAEFAGKLGVTVPPYQPAKLIARAPEAGVRMVVRAEKPTPSAGHARYQQIVKELAAGSSATPKASAPAAEALPAPWLTLERPRCASFNKMWPVLLAIAQAPEKTINSHVRESGVSYAAYNAFRSSWLPGFKTLDIATLERFRAWAVETFGEAAVIESARLPLGAEHPPAAELPNTEQTQAGVETTRSPVEAHAAWRIKIFGDEIKGLEDLSAFNSLSDLLDELVTVARAYGRARRRGHPCTRLRRSLIEISTEVVEQAVPGGAAAVADGKAQP